MISPYTLSRSSRLYKFVFGRGWGWLEGFPEPRNGRISLGLFGGLFLVMSFLRPFASIMLSLMAALMVAVSFLADGSYARGNMLEKMTITKIEPPRSWCCSSAESMSPTNGVDDFFVESSVSVTVTRPSLTN